MTVRKSATATTEGDSPEGPAPLGTALAGPENGQRGAPAAGGRVRSVALTIVSRYWLVLFLVIEVVTFSLMRRDTFMTSANLHAILLLQAVPLTAALALTLPLIVGEFDLTVGVVTTGSAVVIAGMMRRLPTGPGHCGGSAGGEVRRYVEGLLTARSK